MTVVLTLLRMVPLAWWGWAAIGGAALLWHFRAVDRAWDEGYAKHKSETELANRRVRDAADDAAKRVDACYDRGPEWMWDARGARCVRSVPDVPGQPSGRPGNRP